MAQWKPRKLGRLISNSYEYSQRPSVEECLKLAFKISQDSRYQVTKVWIDEPSGMDSDWKHYEGALLQGIGEDEFMREYRDLDLEWVTLKGKIGNETIKYYIGREQIKVAYFPTTPEQITSTALAIAEKALMK